MFTLPLHGFFAGTAGPSLCGQPSSIPLLAHFEIVPLRDFQFFSQLGAIGDALLDALAKQFERVCSACRRC